MNKATNKPVCHGLGFLAAMALALSLGGAASAAPIIDNNVGTWTDAYHDNVGVQTNFNTVVDCDAGVVRLEAGQYNPSLRLAIRISRAVNAPIEEIFTFD